MTDVKPEVVVLRALELADLRAVAVVHIAAFPQSALTRLRMEAVRRYYEWQLIGPHETTAVGLFINDVLAGFCFGGIFRGALGGFLRANRTFLTWQVLTRPWLIGHEMFRERLCAGVRHLFRRHRKRQQPCDLVAPASFGILALAVHPAFQGLGVGKRLMRHMEQSARVKGFVEMNLTVNPDNVRGIGFYTEQHWARVFDNGHWTGSMKKQLIPRGVNG